MEEWVRGRGKDWVGKLGGVEGEEAAVEVYRMEEEIKLLRRHQVIYSEVNYFSITGLAFLLLELAVAVVCSDEY